MYQIVEGSISRFAVTREEALELFSCDLPRIGQQPRHQLFVMRHGELAARALPQTSVPARMISQADKSGQAAEAQIDRSKALWSIPLEHSRSRDRSILM
jgi:hypothetical protein